MTPPSGQHEELASDREILKLLIKDAVAEGMKEHQREVHAPMEARLDETRRIVWLGVGGVSLLSVLLRKLWP